MRSGFVWEARCPKCDHTDGSTAVYVREQPTGSPPACGWCLNTQTEWAQSYIPSIGLTVINTRPDIPQHYNPAFDCIVRSREHLEHLQAVHGVEDADVDTRVGSDGVPSFVPRDAGKPTDDGSHVDPRDGQYTDDELGGSAYAQVHEDYMEMTGGDEKKATELTERTLENVPGAQ